METKKKQSKTILILALVSILFCGCPGCLLFLPGVGRMIETIDGVQSLVQLPTALFDGFLAEGWMLCLGTLLILVPTGLGIFYLMLRKQTKNEPSNLKPTGLSEDEPLPPTR